MIEFLLFKGIDIYSGEGVIQFLVGHFEKGSSDFSRKIINDLKKKIKKKIKK